MVISALRCSRLSTVLASTLGGCSEQALRPAHLPAQNVVYRPPHTSLALGMPVPVAATMPTASAGPEVAEAGTAPLAPLKAAAALDVDALFSEEGRARQQGSLRCAGVVQSQLPPASAPS